MSYVVLQQPAPERLSRIVTRSSSSGSRVTYLIGLLIAGITGLLLRSLMLSQNLWRDEVTSYFTATLPDVPQIISRTSIVELNPPGFFVLLHYWIRAFGANSVIMKLLPLLFSTGALLFAILIAARITRGLTLIVATSLLVTNYSSAYYATELRPYATAAFLLTVGMYCAVRWFENSGKMSRLCFGVGGIAALTASEYVSYIAVIAVLSIGIAALLARIEWRRLLIFEAQFLVTPLVFAIPLYGLARLQKSYGFLATPLPLAHRPTAVFTKMSQAFPISPPQSMHAIDAALGIAVAALFAVSLYRHLRSYNAHSSVSILIIGSFAIACLIEGFNSLLAYRYAVPIVQFGIIGVAAGGGDIARILLSRRARIPAGITVFFCVSLLVLGSVEQFLAARQPKTYFAGVPRTLPRGADVAYVVAPDDDAQTFAYYNKSARNVYGFARWSDPELYDIRGYNELWNDPTLLTTAMTNVAALRDHRIRELVLITVGARPEKLVDVGPLKYSRVSEFRDRLLKAYQLIDRTCVGSGEAKLTIETLDLGSASFSAKPAGCS